MKEIIAITDYKGHFGSRYDSVPYRSGMDLEKLRECFLSLGFSLRFIRAADVMPGSGSADRIFIYTSQEDNGLYYKSYLEDVVLGLETAGSLVIPSFSFLRANSNKSFMEILRNVILAEVPGNLKSVQYGTLQELLEDEEWYTYPVVVKGSSGANGKNVFLAGNRRELEMIARKISRSASIKEMLKEEARSLLYKGYRKESAHRSKFILQEFLPGLKNDWKIYVFWDKYYIFYRPVLKHRGFRASGGGYDNYFFGKDAMLPDGILDFARDIFLKLKVPNASLDICFDGSRFHLLEFQCLYFGTAGILTKYSKEYFASDMSNGWKIMPNSGNLEMIYSESIASYINAING